MLREASSPFNSDSFFPKKFHFLVKPHQTKNNTEMNPFNIRNYLLEYYWRKKCKFAVNS